MKAAVSWLALLLLGLALIAVGWQGSAGRVLAVIFEPGALTVGDSDPAPNAPRGGGSGDNSVFN